MATFLRWKGEKAKSWVEEKIGEKLDKIRFGMEADIKNSFVTPPSSKGGPPAVQTGRMKSGVTTEREGLVIRVGNTVKPYPLILETSEKLDRKWLKPVWMKWLPKIKKMLRIR